MPSPMFPDHASSASPGLQVGATQSRQRPLPEDTDTSGPVDERLQGLKVLQSLRDLRKLRARSALAEAQRQVELADARILAAERCQEETTAAVSDRRRQLLKAMLGQAVDRKAIDSMRQSCDKLRREITRSADAVYSARTDRQACQGKLDDCEQSFRRAAKAKEKLDQGLKYLQQTERTS